ncbi:uncharacterized protein DSM5745_03505 [Aspergillus mulundensis]|uniref:PARP-type domain-containing protein n=1 Tax=Aspergillus mulundensis TaxID=1810919 RepID=A0A3D8SKN2_9EURO|nr:Uncharacterized protein DSM5745_03505 [Aspergillus mulundensis]RDW86863.1 Uncharacterized protein DSM5745_03505 [Aspergillus mulundensis]
MPYRVEKASTGRAGCQNKECKDSKVKIGKGELRFGTWVDTEKFQTWYWRHWGCVTPKIIANVLDSIGEGDDLDLDMLDGYEDLPSDLQEKIEKAMKQGHVDDEEWRGDAELNVPGASGFRVKTPAKKAQKEDEDENKGAAKKKKTPAKKGKKAKDSDEEEKTPASKTKKRTRLQVEDDKHDVETASPKRPRRKPTGYPSKVPSISSDSDSDSGGSAFDSPEPKPKRNRKAKEAKPAPKRGKKKAVEDSEAESPAEKPKRGGRKRTA